MALHRSVAAFIFASVCTSSLDAQILDRMRTPQVTVAVQHAPTVKVPLDHVAFGEPQGKCADALSDALLADFAASDFKNPLLLANGLFISDDPTRDTDVGEDEDPPELTFDGGLWAAAELNLGDGLRCFWREGQSDKRRGASRVRQEPACGGGQDQSGRSSGGPGFAKGRQMRERVHGTRSVPVQSVPSSTILTTSGRVRSRRTMSWRSASVAGALARRRRYMPPGFGPSTICASNSRSSAAMAGAVAPSENPTSSVARPAGASLPLAV